MTESSKIPTMYLSDTYDITELANVREKFK